MAPGLDALFHQYGKRANYYLNIDYAQRGVGGDNSWESAGALRIFGFTEYHAYSFWLQPEL